MAGPNANVAQKIAKPMDILKQKPSDSSTVGMPGGSAGKNALAPAPAPAADAGGVDYERNFQPVRQLTVRGFDGKEKRTIESGATMKAGWEAPGGAPPAKATEPFPIKRRE